MRFTLSLFSGLLPLFSVIGNASADRIYTITNNCPTSIKVYSGGHSRGTIAPRKSFVKAFPTNWSGFIYTDANGGNAKGSKTTKAGFYGETDYYYIVKDPKVFSVGVSIVPKSAKATKVRLASNPKQALTATKTGPFCAQDVCDSSKCSSAFSITPTRFPGPENTAPITPLYACPGSRVGYTVTFCPSGTFPPPSTAVSLHPNGNAHKCVTVPQEQYQSGSIVTVSDCKDTSAQKWILNRGKTTVQLAGTPFCLDAGAKPRSRLGVKLAKCTKGSRTQTWKYDHDNEISLVGTDLCLDLTAGSVANGNQLQTYPCYYLNTNQLWSRNSTFSP